MTSVLITPTELAALPAEDIVIIDTRAPEAFAAGHIAGAVNLHDIFTIARTKYLKKFTVLDRTSRTWKMPHFKTI